MKKPNNDTDEEEFEHKFSATFEFDLFPAIMFVVLLGVVAYMLYLTFSR